MTEDILLQHYLLVGSLLFAIGLIGFLSRRNLIVMFLAAEMMLQGVAVNLVAFSRYHNNFGGQLLVIFVITVAACEAAIALALVLMLYRRSGTLDVTFWQHQREEGVEEFVDHEIPEDVPPHEHYPHLTPAGVEPAHTEEEEVDTFGRTRTHA